MFVGEAASDRRPLRSFLWSWWTLAVLVIGWAVRVWVLLTPLGALNADESYTGLQAAEILTGRLPVVLGGLTYTAPVESYLFAPVVGVFGLHVIPLKLVSSLGWAVAAVCTVGAARRVGSDAAAALAGAFVWIAPGALAVITVRAYVGYSAGLAAVAALLWVAQVVVARDSADGGVLRPRESALLGLLAGAAAYFHPMYLAVVVPSVAVVSWYHRRDLRRWWLPASSGFLVALGPFIAWNLKNGLPSLDQPAQESDGPFARFVGFFTGLLPRVFGMRGIHGPWIFGRPLAMIVLLALAAIAVVGVITLLRMRTRGAVALLAPFLGVWFLMAAFTNLSMVLDGRYGIIALPVVVITLAIGAVRLVGSTPLRLAGVGVVWLGVLVVPWVYREAGTELQDPNRFTSDLVELVESRGFDRVAGYYWTVFPMEAVSGQDLRVAVSGHPFVVLLADTQRLVEATPDDRLVFVFEGPAPGPLLRMPPDQYDVVQIGTTYVYFPRSDGAASSPPAATASSSTVVD